MPRFHLVFPLALIAIALGTGAVANAATPLGTPGQAALYTLDGGAAPATSLVSELRVSVGAEDTWNGTAGQWLCLEATKRSGETFSVWMLCSAPPAAELNVARATVLRYVLRQGMGVAAEYRHAVTGAAVLPGSGAWRYMLPRAETVAANLLPESAQYLGHAYHRGPHTESSAPTLPVEIRVHLLRPDVLTGVPSTNRQADETRRYDDSEYDYVPLSRDDLTLMVETGLNCFRATPETVGWLEGQGVFYWGIGGADVSYPECLYQPLYIGPALFLDEPAVVTRDHDIRPKLREDPQFRRDITPQAAMAFFEAHYADVIANGAPTQLMKGLSARPDVDLGAMTLVQPNIYSWETMVSSAAHELLYDPVTPGAIVFEPPGQLGLRRTVPAWNMSYGCQIPVTGRDHFIDVIIGYLRGAARASGKEWGISIYGGVDSVEADAFITRAYELGATRFFYWDNARLACVPFGEVLGHTRQLQRLADTYPNRDLNQLRDAAEVAILFPPGYNLGHVMMGKGLLWGVPELNLERLNQAGVPYRTVMGNLFTEIERCLRLGVAFDLLWDLPALHPEGYREVVRIREDGKVEVASSGASAVLDGPRVPERPEGRSPRLTVGLPGGDLTAPCTVSVSAEVAAGDAPVYYAPQPDGAGVHPMRQVLWELYGPNEEDYGHRPPEVMPGAAEETGRGQYEVSATLHIEKPGRYRLRAATTDLAGRSTVVWTDLEIK